MFYVVQSAFQLLEESTVYFPSTVNNGSGFSWFTLNVRNGLRRAVLDIQRKWWELFIYSF